MITSIYKLWTNECIALYANIRIPLIEHVRVCEFIFGWQQLNLFKDLCDMVIIAKFWKTSFEKNCFSAWASTLNMGLIIKVDMVCLSPVGYGV